MEKTKTKPWDAAEHLQTRDDMALYLEAALEGDDSVLVAAALGDIARAKGMNEIARDQPNLLSLESASNICDLSLNVAVQA